MSDVSQWRWISALSKMEEDRYGVGVLEDTYSSFRLKTRFEGLKRTHEWDCRHGLTDLTVYTI